MIRFETFDRRMYGVRRHFFRIVAEGNNEIVAASQPYRTRGQRDETIALIKAGGPDAPIVEGRR